MVLALEEWEHRKWRPFPALGKILHGKSHLPGHGPRISTADTPAEAFARLLDIAALAGEYKADLLAAVTAEHEFAKTAIRDLHHLSENLESLRWFIEGKKQEVDGLCREIDRARTHL